MKMMILPAELQPGDVYRGKRIVYVDAPPKSAVVIVEFETGKPVPFASLGLIEVERPVERIEG